jgi:ABC-type branched-subunit amino acid transport system ATPase component
VDDVLLRVRGLTVRFGGVRAVDDLHLDVRRGQLVGLIGPNGAGKTTTIDALTGFVASSGRVEFDGHELDGEPPHRRAALGLVRTWQSLELFDDLSVVENVEVAVKPAADEHAADVAEAALERLGLGPVASRLPTELSYGQRKLVAVARALAARPALVLLDEPAAGLDADESQAFGALLRSLVDDDGLALVLVDHDMALVLGVCDRVTVLEFGHVLAEGPAAHIRTDERVIAAYLGERHRR